MGHVPLLVSFSGGRSSALMTKMLIDEHGAENLIITFANTGKEELQTLDFVHECDQRWNLNVVWLEYDNQFDIEKGHYKHVFRLVDYASASRNGEPFTKLITAKKFVPNIAARFCTGDLKVKPMKKYMLSLGYTFWQVAMGIRYDEPLRWGKYIQNTQKEPFHYVLPLYEEGITKPMVLNYWRNQPFDLQLKDYEGNCDLCFLKGAVKKKRLIKERPERADWWIEQEQRVGGSFRKGQTYQGLREGAMGQMDLFDLSDELEYPCHCTID